MDADTSDNLEFGEPWLPERDDAHVVPALNQRLPKVEDMRLLAADDRREPLRDQHDAHQPPLGWAAALGMDCDPDVTNGAACGRDFKVVFSLHGAARRTQPS